MPEGTTWLDLVTLAIAAGGLLTACIGLALTVKRDQALGRVGVEMALELDDSDAVQLFALAIVNTERRTVTIERAGLAIRKRGERSPMGWIQRSFATGDAALPETLEPGAPAYRVRAPLYRARNHFFPEPPKWAWCEDTYGSVYWVRIPPAVISAIAETKRRKRGPTSGSGHPTTVDADDSETLTQDELAV